MDSNLIQCKEFYEKKLNAKMETDIKLSLANLDLLKKKQAKLQSELDDVRAAKAEWENAKREAEEKLRDPDPAIKRWLETDFHREVSLRKRGGDPEMQGRLGEPVYGFKHKSRNRREVLIPKLQRDGDRQWYTNEEVEIVDRKDNQEAFQEWTSYMEKGLHIDSEWSFDKLFAEIEKFFKNAPDLERYGEAYTVYEKGGELYQSESLVADPVKVVDSGFRM